MIGNRDYLGNDAGFFRSIASTTPDPAPLPNYPNEDDHTYINDVVSAKSGSLESGNDLIRSRPYVPYVREAQMNLAISLPPAVRGHDPTLSGSKETFEYSDDIFRPDFEAGHEPDRVQRNTVSLEYKPWDRNLVWGIEDIHPELVDEYGMIRTAG